MQVRILLVNLKNKHLISLKKFFFLTCTFLKEFLKKTIISRQLFVLISDRFLLVKSYKHTCDTFFNLDISS